MNCGVCNKPMRKDIKIDDVRTCYVCRKIWLDNFKKMKKMKHNLTASSPC